MQVAGLPFADVLPDEEIQRVCDEEGVDFGSDEDDVYHPPLTLWAFLSQVLHTGAQRSCTAAVVRVVALLTTLGQRLGPKDYVVVWPRPGC
jgi:hypothetical protein